MCPTPSDPFYARGEEYGDCPMGRKVGAKLGRSCGREELGGPKAGNWAQYAFLVFFSFFFLFSVYVSFYF